MKRLINSYRTFNHIRTLALSSALVFTVACGEGDSTDDDDEAATTTGTGTGTGSTTAKQQAVAAASSVGDLNLASAFEITLPDALGGSSSASLALTAAGSKSMEACQMGETVKEVTKSLTSVANFMCHIEAESDKIKFGTKYRIVTNGEEFAKIWIDNSDTSKLRLGFCSKDDEGQNNEIIEITGLTAEIGASGTIIQKGTNAFENNDGENVTGTYHRSTTFDMTEEGKTSVNTSDRHTEGTNAFVRSVVLTLLDSGISTALLASKGTWKGDEFAERGMAVFDGDHGATIFENKGTHNNQTFEFTRKATFDSAGVVVDASTVDKFAEAGSLYLETDDIPEYLAADFAPTALDGWVGGGCEDYESEIDLDPESAAHAACDGDRNQDHIDCWDNTKYEQGDDINADGSNLDSENNE